MSQYNKTKAKNKSLKNRGLTRKSYSDFWLNDYYNNYSNYKLRDDDKDDQSAAVFAKAVKLHKHQKAISNFVKIVTNKNIPVTFEGSTSYTNGDKVVISADIKDSNFDVSVGLALHEGSHIALSDMTLWNKTINTINDTCDRDTLRLYKTLLNWLEDRRIDNTIFKNSPGYKAYYHKLYDYYWNSEDVNQGMLSDDFRNNKDLDHWMFNIINSQSPQFNPNRMAGLKDVMDILDIKNIGRLTSTADVIEVVDWAVPVIKNYLKGTFSPEDDTTGESKSSDSTNKEPNSSKKSNDYTPEDINENDEDNEEMGEGGDNNNTDDPSNEPSPFAPSVQLDATQKAKIEQKYKEQQALTNGEVQKKEISKELADPLDAFDTQGGRLVELENAFYLKHSKRSSSSKKQSMPGYFTDLTKSPNYYTYVNRLSKAFHGEDAADTNGKSGWEYRTIVATELRKINPGLYDFLSNIRNGAEYRNGYTDGLAIGGLIAKKLQTHGESRDRVDNRQITGTLDKRRIACLGYGVEQVFQRINIQRNKPAHIHLSIDGSGSMNDNCKWGSTIKLATAIARGIKGKSQLSLSISVRVQAQDLFNTKNQILRQAPAVAVIWDSRNGGTIHSLPAILSAINFSSSTPEGLCYEVLYKSNYLTPGSAACDSYLVNISDGEPNMSYDIKTSFDDMTYLEVPNKHTSPGAIYTNRWWNKLKSRYNVVGMSYFIKGPYGDYYSTKALFEYMYGKEAQTINVTEALTIAQTLNGMLLKSTSNVLV